VDFSREVDFIGEFRNPPIGGYPEIHTGGYPEIHLCGIPHIDRFIRSTIGKAGLENSSLTSNCLVTGKTRVLKSRDLLKGTQCGTL
jgi:hypothetical protein